jgi:hypothetical protein
MKRLLPIWSLIGLTTAIPSYSQVLKNVSLQGPTPEQSAVRVRLPGRVLASARQASTLWNLQMVLEPNSVSETNAEGRLGWGLRWKTDADDLQITVDYQTELVLKVINNRVPVASRHALASGEDFKVSRSEAIQIVRSLSQKLGMPDGEWRLEEDTLHIPPQSYRQHDHATWKIKLRRYVHGYLSWTEQVYAQVSPFDGTVEYWSRRPPMEYLKPSVPTLSEDEAMRIASKVTGRRVLPITWNVCPAPTLGPYWLPLGPGLSQNRLSYLFYFPDKDESTRPGLLVMVDSATGEVGSFQMRVAASQADPSWEARIQNSYHPRGALLAALVSTIPESKASWKELETAIVSGKPETSSLPSSRCVRSTENGYTFALDTEANRLFWSGDTGQWGNPKMGTKDRWFFLGLSEAEMRSLQDWRAVRKKADKDKR